MRQKTSLKEMIGKRFHSLVVVGISEKKTGNHNLLICQCDCGNVILNRSYYIKNRLKSCGCILEESHKSLIGKKFNRLTIVDWIKDKKMYLCKCECNKDIYVTKSNLISDNTKSCGCLQKEKLRDRSWKGYKDISGEFLYQIKNSATKRHIEFNVSSQEMWNKYIEQDKKCNISGLSIKFSDNSKNRSNATCSLDRINSKDGYIKDNIQWLHKDINQMKWDLSEEEFYHYIYLINNPIKKNEYYNNYSLSFNTERKSNWSGYCGLPGGTYNRMIKGAKSRKYTFELSKRYLWELFVKQNGRCAITGIALTLNRDMTKNISGSLDRIDNQTGYVENNVQWIHKDINQMKYNFDMITFMNHCSIIYNKKFLSGGVSLRT